MVQMYRPSFRRPGSSSDELIDIDKLKIELDKVKAEFDGKFKAEVEEKVKAVLKEREETEKKDKADKIARAVEVAKTIKDGVIKEGDRTDLKDGGIACPTCHTGHVHKLETDKTGLVWKCHGDKCGLEYVMVPKVSEYKCRDCGMPIKKPDSEEKIKDLRCPFCNGTSAMRHDWSKMWNVKR